MRKARLLVRRGGREGENKLGGGAECHRGVKEKEVNTGHVQVNFTLQIYEPVRRAGSRMVPAWEEDLWTHKTVKGRRGLFEGGGSEGEKDGCEWRRKVGGELLAAC